MAGFDFDFCNVGLARNNFGFRAEVVELAHKGCVSLSRRRDSSAGYKVV